MKSRLKKAIEPIVFSICIAGCSTAPIYDWRADNALAAQTNEVTGEMTMVNAITYLQKARTAYRSQITGQMKDEATVGQWIIGSAGVLLAAAGLRAHTDALLVGGTAMSTGYAMSTTAMPRGRGNRRARGDRPPRNP